MTRKVVLLLSLMGLAISLYLTYAKVTSGPFQCRIGECETVLNSEYSEIFGIPVALFGVLFYLPVFLFSYYSFFKVLLLISVFGFLFSIYLTYLQAFIIGEYCSLCLSFAIISTAIFLLILKFPKNTPERTII